MKINPNDPVQPPETFRKKQTALGSDAVGKKTASAGDAFIVELSSKIKQMSEPQDDEARQARVAAIRSQLATGDYNISGKDVANKILDLLKN